MQYKREKTITHKKYYWLYWPFRVAFLNKGGNKSLRPTDSIVYCLYLLPAM